MSKPDFDTDRRTLQESADYIGVTVETLKNWRCAGENDLPKAVPVGGKLYYRKSDWDAWLDKRQAAATN